MTKNVARKGTFLIRKPCNIILELDQKQVWLKQEIALPV